ncbi:MAG: vitamin K epoxide reductase family protein [Candidatus Marsarchaeota archaeon]|jgi:uncharacterized membrane protein|nr:vitamin K epoxide reductase family protein [Candidatus Marsarchaeota archaeon]
MVSKRTLTVMTLIMGIIVSVYLVIVHFEPQLLICSTSGVVDCPYVLGSSYSTIFGIPLAIIGFVWVLVMLMIVLKRNNEIADTIYPIWMVLGALGVAYSFLAQYLLKHICKYCFTLDIIIIITIAIQLIMSDRDARPNIHKGSHNRRYKGK